MKKLYVVAASLFALTIINAQSLSAVSANQNPVKNSQRPAALLYEQVPTSGDGIISDIISNGNYVIAADDFTLTDDVTAKKFSFVGFQNAANLLNFNRGMLMYIYTDNGGKPSGNPGDANPYVAKVDLTQTSTAYTITTPAAGYFTYNVDLVEALGTAPNLVSGTKYWVLFAPKLNLTTFSSTERWNWTVGTVNSHFAKLLDPSDTFGVGATSWTNISSLTGDSTYNGLAFSIEGDNNLGITESYSTIKDVTVTQAADELYIFTKNEKLKSAVIYSADGKIVLKGNTDKINISGLTKGIYIVNITTLSGKTLSTKFIKK